MRVSGLLYLWLTVGGRRAYSRKGLPPRAKLTQGARVSDAVGTVRASSEADVACVVRDGSDGLRHEPGLSLFLLGTRIAGGG
jgi:hypothetical protein